MSALYPSQYSHLKEQFGFQVGFVVVVVVHFLKYLCQEEIISLFTQLFKKNQSICEKAFFKLSILFPCNSVT